MKRLKSLTAISILVILSLACTERGSKNIDLSENEQIREEVFNQILNDQDLLDQFMNRMMDQPVPMHWMMENQSFMNHMFDQENLSYIKDHNSEMNSHMIQNMQSLMDNDSSFAREWNRMHGEESMGHMHTEGTEGHMN